MSFSLILRQLASKLASIYLEGTIMAARTFLRLESAENGLPQHGEVLRERWTGEEVVVDYMRTGGIPAVIGSRGQVIQDYHLWKWDYVSRPLVVVTVQENHYH